MASDFKAYKAEVQSRIDDRKVKEYFTSRFNHMRRQNGFRPGELHTFIAEKGGGKSTLIRAWALECVAQGKRVLIRLSEEYSQDYRDEVVYMFQEETKQYLDNLIVDSELELAPEHLGKNYLAALDAKCKKERVDILILDNFTTSKLSRTSPNEQEESAVTLRKIAARNQIPVIVAAHTEKGFRKDKAATGDNIRGNMTLANTAAYIYTLTIFHDAPGRPAVLFVDKARNHPAANKQFYILDFNMEHGVYTGDKPATREIVKEIFRGQK